MQSGSLTAFRRSSLLGVFLLVPLALAPARLGAQSPDACEPSPVVKAQLHDLPSQTPAETDWEFHKKKLAAIQSLLARFPHDVFVQRAYIRTMDNFLERTQVIDEYKTRHETSPEDAILDYLYGLTLVGRDSGQAVKLFKAALAQDPAFPLPHRQLASIYTSPAFLDKEQSLTHLRAYLQACPASFDGYDALAGSDDKDLIRQGAERLRALIEKRNDVDAVNAYQTLWSLEFKAHPPSEYAPLRKQVQADLERIRAMNAAMTYQDRREWYETLEDGYKLANDQKQADAIKAERQERAPYTWELAAMSKWQDDHHYPAQDAPADQKHAYFTEELAQTQQWIKERPNLTFIYSERLDAMEHLEDIPPADVEATAEQEVRIAGLNNGPEGPGSDDYFTAAGALADKHLEPEQTLELAKKGLAKAESEAKEPYYDLYATEENVTNQKFYRTYLRTQGMEYEVDAYVELKEPQQARLVLENMDEQVQELKSLAGSKQDRQQAYSFRLAAYWGLMGRDAELEGHKLDAMAFYENGLLTRLDAKLKPETGVKDELADNALRLWTALGGSKEGWETWYGQPAESLANQATLTWNDANEPLPSFQIADMNGKTWDLTSLKGKTVFLNFWASW